MTDADVLLLPTAHIIDTRNHGFCISTDTSPTTDGDRDIHLRIDDPTTPDPNAGITLRMPSQHALFLADYLYNAALGHKK